MFGLSFSTLIMYATLAAKYGPPPFDLFKKFGPLGADIVHAVTPVVSKQLESGQLQALGKDTAGQIKAILAGLGHVLTPAEHAHIETTVSEAERQWMDRASGVDSKTGQPLSGL